MPTKSDLEHEDLLIKLNRQCLFSFFWVANLNRQYVNILSLEEMNRKTVKKKGGIGKKKKKTHAHI
jgi:hypothetical protein